jgi:hypothetical protein
MKRLFRSSIVAALAAGVLLGLVGPAGAFSNNFDSNTDGWFDLNGATITKQPSGYDNDVYAEGVLSSSDGFHARLDRGACDTQSGGSGDAVNCYGPYTYWGDGNDFTWNGPYTTQVDIYLDTAYANANPDTYSGNLADLTAPGGSTSAGVKGTRFDFTSAINSSTPDGNGDAQHLRDFGFNVSTGYVDDDCAGFMITGQTVVNRINANPNIGGHNPQCVDVSGWYTFKHSFSDEGGFLKVVMEIIPVGSNTPKASWTITGIDPTGTFGCNRYGWFSNQEIFGLPIDNASMTGGCAAPTQVGVIAPTATTCLMYRDNGINTPDLEELLYTVKGGKINAVSPGVFFYYTKVSGDEGDTVDITQENDATTAPDIPVNQGQVVLYDAVTCKVVKAWAPDVGSDGTATGELPKDGNFIIGVKYNPSALKGAAKPVPPTVEYTFGTELNDVAADVATIDLAPKA